MADNKLTVRQMSYEEFSSYTLDLANKEGWAPGKDDACYYFTDTSGFLVGELDGKKVATVSCVKYNNGQSFGGYYIVDKPYKGMGYGLKILNAVLATVDQSQYNIGLDAVIQCSHLYETRGFKTAWTNLRYKIDATKALNISKQSPAVAIKPVVEVDFEKVAEYNIKIFGFDRRVFLQKWVTAPHQKGFVALENSEVVGFAMIREVMDGGYRFGPLIAERGDIARSLLKASAEVAVTDPTPSNRYMLLDVPEPNTEAMEMVQELECDVVFRTHRMYTKAEPKDFLKAKVFGITSFEIS